MYHVLVIGLKPSGWFKSLSLNTPLRALKGAARALTGFKGAQFFRNGPYIYAALSWTSPGAIAAFVQGDGLATLEQAAQTAATVFETHAFVCETPPSKSDLVTLWHSARHSAAA
ncbi:hypothetical protein [Tropicibacter oceani]|uniref:GYD domain-containing protein n=1 Tax=Tropicibacter oceani TaxID=3058420 RepID=A0ABY8QLZ5_9RHOB|nr:hypothetical protein [Tropicibacter oceani]WGW05666.1 hypothetical protein QF118_09010 [Tropicibacter oceani]